MRHQFLNVYRVSTNRTIRAAGEKYAQHVRDIIDRLRRTHRLGRVHCRDVSQCGGQICRPRATCVKSIATSAPLVDFVSRTRCKPALAVLGTIFLAFEDQDVIPDIVVMGKPNGERPSPCRRRPTPAIADSFDNGMEFFSTFGANTVSCASGIGRSASDARRRVASTRPARRPAMLEGLRPLMKRHPTGRRCARAGLFLEWKLVGDRETLVPAGEEHRWSSTECGSAVFCSALMVPITTLIRSGRRCLFPERMLTARGNSRPNLVEEFGS